MKPGLRYFGSKASIAPQIVALMPKHRIYVEPYGGSAAVLLAKPRVYSEVYNDLYFEIWNFFNVLRDPEGAKELCRLLEFTPYSRTEFEESFRSADNAIEAARKLVVRSYQGYGADSVFGRRTGWRAGSNKSGSTPAMDWMRHVDRIMPIHERMRGVAVENREAIEVITENDGPDTLFYCDPPYMPEARGLSQGTENRKHFYAHEMTVADHLVLGDTLRRSSGFAMISGYRTALYDSLYEGWTRYEFPARADGGGARTEYLWLNPKAARAVDQPRLMEVV